MLPPEAQPHTLLPTGRHPEIGMLDVAAAPAAGAGEYVGTSAPLTPRGIRDVHQRAVQAPTKPRARSKDRRSVRLEAHEKPVVGLFVQHAADPAS